MENCKFKQPSLNQTPILLPEGLLINYDPNIQVTVNDQKMKEGPYLIKSQHPIKISNNKNKGNNDIHTPFSATTMLTSRFTKEEQQKFKELAEPGILEWEALGFEDFKEIATASYAAQLLMLLLLGLFVFKRYCRCRTKSPDIQEQNRRKQNKDPKKSVAMENIFQIKRASN